MGTALIGAIVISVLAGAFLNQLAGDPRISDELRSAIGIELDGTVQFLPASEVEAVLEQTSLSDAEKKAIVEAYETGELQALRLGLLVAAAIVVVSLFIVRRIPDVSFEELAAAQDASV